MYRDRSSRSDSKNHPQDSNGSSKKRGSSSRRPPDNNASASGGGGSNGRGRSGSIDMDLSGKNSPKDVKFGFIGPQWVPAGTNAGGTFEVMSTMPMSTSTGDCGGMMSQMSMGGPSFSNQSMNNINFSSYTNQMGGDSFGQPQYSMAQPPSSASGMHQQQQAGFMYGPGGSMASAATMMGGYPMNMSGAGGVSGMIPGPCGSVSGVGGAGQDMLMGGMMMNAGNGGPAGDNSIPMTSSHTPMLDLSSYGNPAMPSSGSMELQREHSEVSGMGLDGSGAGMMGVVPPQPPLPPPDPSMMFSMMGMAGYVPPMGQFDFNMTGAGDPSGPNAMGFPLAPNLPGMGGTLKSDDELVGGGGPMVPPGGIMPPDGMNLPGVMPPGGTGDQPAVALANGAIQFRDSILYPPHPNFTITPTRERPPVCRTIFVGGVPENCNEEVLRDVFESCGEISSVRLKASKNFAHIRFTNQDSVDRALYFSGYRIRINDRSDKEWSGRLHIDFAQDRDDQQEWEIQQKALRHSRAPSPPKTVRFSEREAAGLIEQLKNVESFPPSVNILQAWLDRGDCSKRTSATFYSMIGAVNAHIRRLTADRSTFIAEMTAFRDQHNERLQKIMTELDAIREVFVAARKQKNWDHFTKPQRKNLEAWIKMVEDMHHEHETEMLQDRQEMEMEESDEEAEDGPSAAKKARTDKETIASLTAALSTAEENYSTLQAEHSLMRAQMDAISQQNLKLKSETEETPSSEPEVKTIESSDPDRKEIEISTLRQTLQGIQEKLLATAQTLQIKESEIQEITHSNSLLKAELSSVFDKPDSSSSSKLALPPSTGDAANEDKLIALISIFLHVHPFGASVDYIVSYLNCVLRNVRSRDIENTMERHPQLFKLSTVGVGASIERKWTFLAYSTV